MKTYIVEIRIKAEGVINQTKLAEAINMIVAGHLPATMPAPRTGKAVAIKGGSVRSVDATG